MRFDEGKFYRFGLGMGFANVAHNGLQLGAKKTIGKILQPVNFPGRFPEYHFMESRIGQRLQSFAGPMRPRILDVSSPKCFSLYLAYHYDAEVHLSDIDSPSVKEAEVLWRAIQKRARGDAVFSIQDARSPRYKDEEFDIVFSMSVVEHVAGAAGDCEAIRSMIRLLKPGGLLLITVPIGQTYVEQEIVGFEGAARSTGDRRSYFFQRIYTPATASERLLQCSSAIDLREAVTISRSSGRIARWYGGLGLNARGILGFLNPFLSRLLNEAAEGVIAPPSEYGKVHTTRDLYGDLMLAWQKRDSSPLPTSADAVENRASAWTG